MVDEIATSQKPVVSPGRKYLVSCYFDEEKGGPRAYVRFFSYSFANPQTRQAWDFLGCGPKGTIISLMC